MSGLSSFVLLTLAVGGLGFEFATLHVHRWLEACFSECPLSIIIIIIIIITYTQ